MQTQASITNYGGEVYNSEPGGHHTGTDMGSGAFASAGAGYTAFQGHLQYIDTTYHRVDPTPNNNYTGFSSCYSLTTGYETQNGSDWYFGTQSMPMNGYFEYLGGPGYNTNCQ